MSPVVVNQVPQDLPRGPGTELELARIEIPSSFARVQGLKAELAQKRTELPEDEVNAWADEQLEALYQESNEVVDELRRQLHKTMRPLADLYRELHIERTVIPGMDPANDGEDAYEERGPGPDTHLSINEAIHNSLDYGALGLPSEARNRWSVERTEGTVGGIIGRMNPSQSSTLVVLQLKIINDSAAELRIIQQPIANLDKEAFRLKLAATRQQTADELQVGRGNGLLLITDQFPHCEITEGSLTWRKPLTRVA